MDVADWTSEGASQKPSALAMVELQTLKSAISELSSLADRLESRVFFLENKLAIHPIVAG